MQIHFTTPQKNQPEKPLSKIAVGSSCHVGSIHAIGLMRRRLFDLGFVPGTKIECLRRSPAGDPTAYLVRGTVIALRLEDAALIHVYPL